MDCNRYPTLSISPNGITVYNTWIGPRKKYYGEMEDEKKAFERSEHLKRNNPKGTLSKKALKRIEMALKWLLFMSRDKKVYYRVIKKYVKFKVTFVTVTLASKQVHSDNEIKSKCLNQLLTELRQVYNMKHYIWRAEKQKNGNIHFHILTNVFIPQDKLCSMWNRIQNKLGYVDRYSSFMNDNIKSFSDYYNMFMDSGTYTQLMQRYIKGRACKFKNPNSTDIHSVKKVKNIAAYLSKYFCKSTQESGDKGEDKQSESFVNGKIWGLSQSLSELKTITIGIGSVLSNEINMVYDLMKQKVYQDKFFTFIRVSFKELIKLKAENIMSIVYKKLLEFNEKSLSLC